MRDKVRRYILGVHEDAGKWEIFRVCITLLLTFFLVLITIQVFEMRTEIKSLEEATNNVTFFCEYVYPRLKDPSLGPIPLEEIPNLPSSGLP